MFAPATYGWDLSGLHRGDEVGGADEGDRTFDVVGKDVEACFGCDVFQRPHLEVTSSHPVFERTEDVFDGSSSNTHGAGPVVEAGLHGLHDLFMLPAGDAALRSRRALRL